MAQGIGEAMKEQIVYDRASGQLSTGSFMDYAMPRAGDLPSFRTGFIETPAPSNPLGVKGGSEGGNVATAATIGNAVAAALMAWNVQPTELPLSPPRLWQLIEQGAIIYICGDASKMAPDVRKAFSSIYQDKTGKSEQEANQWLDELTAENRYLVDVWGI